MGTQRTDLLQRFRDGDRDAFRQIVTRYQSALIRLFYRLCWDRARAEDLTQEVYLRILRGSGSYVTRGRLWGYLLRVATNLWIDEYRRGHPFPPVDSLSLVETDGSGQDDASLIAPGPGPDRVACDLEDVERLKAALENLGELHRLVFELAVHQGLPYEQISRILGIPIGTVKSRMHNAVRSLRRILATGEQEGAAQARAARA